MNLPRLIHRGSGLKTHNCRTEIFKALVQVSVDSCDGAMKETFSCLWFLIPQRKARSIDGWWASKTKDAFAIVPSSCL